MITLNEIEKFLAAKKFAIAGVSRNPRKFGSVVYKELKNKGFEVYAINPNTVEIQGEKCYKSVSELPKDVNHLLIMTPKKETAGIVKEAADNGIKMIWIQQASDTSEAVDIAKENNIPVIYKKCIMMFADPVHGFHGFHRFLSKSFGAFPKHVSLN